jgi:hypothetical protein
MNKLISHPTRFRDFNVTLKSSQPTEAGGRRLISVCTVDVRLTRSRLPPPSLASADGCGSILHSGNALALNLAVWNVLLENIWPATFVTTLQEAEVQPFSLPKMNNASIEKLVHEQPHSTSKY